MIESLILQGGVDNSWIRWAPFDGIGRKVRNGLHFTERGFGVRGALTMTTPGDTSLASRAEVEKLMAGGSTRVVR